MASGRSTALLLNDSEPLALEPRQAAVKVKAIRFCQLMGGDLQRAPLLTSLELTFSGCQSGSRGGGEEARKLADCPGLPPGKSAG